MAAERTGSVGTLAASAAATPATTPIATAKPVKLRNACNQCFAAKVRCNGNKSGCERCLDRKLSCKYSESRVGKVVGRRRKRPLEDAVGTINSSEWVIPTYTPPNAIPSPANTSVSDDSTKLLSVQPNWMSSTSMTDRPEITTTMHREPSPARTVDSLGFLDRKTSAAGSTGLPTPALSPPQYAYLSPMMLENKIGAGVKARDSHSTHFLAPSMPIPACRTPEPQQTDDEEMICIRLLGHLKKSSAKEYQSFDDVLALIKKSNAAVRRILKSKTARSDYACVMLLSNIMLRVVALGELACKTRLEEPEGSDTPFMAAFSDNFFTDSDQLYINHDIQGASFMPDRAASLHEVLLQTTDLVMTIANLLKKKPINGFQLVGRHEALHIDLERRLRACLQSLK